MGLDNADASSREQHTARMPIFFGFHRRYSDLEWLAQHEWCNTRHFAKNAAMVASLARELLLLAPVIRNSHSHMLASRRPHECATNQEIGIAVVRFSVPEPCCLQSGQQRMHCHAVSRCSTGRQTRNAASNSMPLLCLELGTAHTLGKRCHRIACVCAEWVYTAREAMFRCPG